MGGVSSNIKELENDPSFLRRLKNPIQHAVSASSALGLKINNSNKKDKDPVSSAVVVFV